MVLIATISWKYSSDVFDFIFLAFGLALGATGVLFIIGILTDVMAYKANVSESIGCRSLIVESEKQFEVWRKDKHGGTYSKLRYSIAKNEFGINNIEYAPGDIIPSKKENNTIVMEVVKVTNDVAGTAEYSVNNQSRSCL
jgi:hypothetical protein